MSQRLRFSIGQAFVPLVVFPLLGPVLWLLTLVIPLALLSLVTFGLGGMLYFQFLGAWWLPGLYILLAPPFLVTGVLIGLASLALGRLSLLATLLAAELAFCAYFAATYWIGGDTANDYANLRASFFKSPSSVITILIAATGCWFVRRAWAGPSPSGGVRTIS